MCVDLLGGTLVQADEAIAEVFAGRLEVGPALVVREEVGDGRSLELFAELDGGRRE